MRRPAVATVLTARPWEEQFVSFVRETAALRIVTRAYEPQEVLGRSPDVIVAGSETSWMSATHVRSWRRKGIRVVGLHQAGDDPGKRLFEGAGADVVLPETTSVVALVRTVQALSVGESPTQGSLIAVTGPRGAPGRTEISLAIAWSVAHTHRTLLLDLDPPSLGIRLGLGPRPSLTDSSRELRVTGVLPPVRRAGALSVLSGLEGGPLTAAIRWELVHAAVGSHDIVIADLGPWPTGSRIMAQARSTVLVCDAGPVGMVRAASLVERWDGATPLLVLNRAGQADVVLARRALGLEPIAVVPDLDGLRTDRQCPPETLLELLAPVRDALLD